MSDSDVANVTTYIYNLYKYITDYLPTTTEEGDVTALNLEGNVLKQLLRQKEQLEQAKPA